MQIYVFEYNCITVLVAGIGKDVLLIVVETDVTAMHILLLKYSVHVYGCNHSASIAVCLVG